MPTNGGLHMNQNRLLLVNDEKVIQEIFAAMLLKLHGRSSLHWMAMRRYGSIASAANMTL